MAQVESIDSELALLDEVIPFPLPDNSNMGFPTDSFPGWPASPEPSNNSGSNSNLENDDSDKKNYSRKRPASQMPEPCHDPRPINSICRTRLLYEFTAPLPNRWKYSMSIWNLRTLELVSCDSGMEFCIKICIS